MSETPGPRGEEDEITEGAQATLRLVNLDPRTKVLNGLIEMTGEHAPLIEEDVAAAKLQKGLFILAHLQGDTRITDLERHIDEYLQSSFGSAQARLSHQARLESARIYSSIDLLREAFAEAETPAGDLDRSRLLALMVRANPSDFWQQPRARETAISTVEEAHKLAQEIASELDNPLSVTEFMQKLADLFRKLGMGKPDLPAEVSQHEGPSVMKVVWKKENEAMVNHAWQEWLKEAQKP